MRKIYTMSDFVLNVVPKVFEAYCKEYEMILSKLTPYPDRNRHSIHEVNQVVNFQKAYGKDRDPEKVITWLELGVKGLIEESNRTSRIDGLIVDFDNTAIILIEAKRLSRENNIARLIDDYQRAKNIKSTDIKGPGFAENAFCGYDVYCLLLADFCTDHNQLSEDSVLHITGEKSTERMKTICMKSLPIQDNYYLMYALHHLTKFSNG